MSSLNHWKFRPEPVAETESVTVAPSMADWLAGAETITGAGVAGVSPPPDEPPTEEPPPPDEAAAMVRTKFAGALVPLALAAVIVAVNVPAVLGVPLITPEAALMDNPDGRPVAAKDEALLEAVTLKVSAVPAVPEALEALEMTGMFPMVKVTVATGPGPAELFALTETAVVAVVVGVPEMCPVVAFTASPAGSPDTL